MYCSVEDGTGDDGRGAICWFCKKGRHAECMVRIPTADRTDGGPHDCAFGTIMARCGCTHPRCNRQGDGGNDETVRI